MDLWKERLVVRVKGDSASVYAETLLCETDISIYVNGVHCMDASSSPADLEDLAVGYAFCRGLLSRREELAACTVTEGRIDLAVVSAPCGALEIRSELTFEPDRVYTVCEEFDSACNAFRRTGAAHAVGLSGADGLVLVREDAARHNALAKVLGAAVLAGISACDKALIFSGRMSGELLEMVHYSHVPILLCHGAATLRAVERADELGITLAGFVRRGYMNIYTHSHRIIKETAG